MAYCHPMNAKTALPYIHSVSASFADAPAGQAVPLRLVLAANFEDMHARAPASFSRQMEQAGFEGRERQICILRDEQGAVAEILAGLPRPLSLYSFAQVAERLKNEFSAEFLKTASFKIDGALSSADLEKACIGWALAGYKFDLYKKDKGKNDCPCPCLAGRRR